MLLAELADVPPAGTVPLDAAPDTEASGTVLEMLEGMVVDVVTAALAVKFVLSPWLIATGVVPFTGVLARDAMLPTGAVSPIGAVPPVGAVPLIGGVPSVVPGRLNIGTGAAPLMELLQAIGALPAIGAQPKDVPLTIVGAIEAAPVIVGIPPTGAPQAIGAAPGIVAIGAIGIGPPGAPPSIGVPALIGATPGAELLQGGPMLLDIPLETGGIGGALAIGIVPVDEEPETVDVIVPAVVNGAVIGAVPVIVNGMEGGVQLDSPVDLFA